MPRYGYRCPQCGPFDLMRPMAESGAPADCPGCGQPAARTISTPYVNLMSATRRKAHQINERSSAEPGVVNRAQLEEHCGRSVALSGAGRCCQHDHGRPGPPKGVSGQG